MKLRQSIKMAIDASHEEKAKEKPSGKHRTVAMLLEQGIDPVGAHVTADEIIRGTGKFRHLIGTVKEVYKQAPFSERVKVRFFNGEEWPTDYPPYRLKLIER